jgi:hypothetical protein
MVLLPPGKFNVDQIIRADNVYTDKDDRRETVQLWPELKDQMRVLPYWPQDISPTEIPPTEIPPTEISPTDNFTTLPISPPCPFHHDVQFHRPVHFTPPENEI